LEYIGESVQLGSHSVLFPMVNQDEQSKPLFRCQW
jgi:hypothetical protein